MKEKMVKLARKNKLFIDKFITQTLGESNLFAGYPLPASMKNWPRPIKERLAFPEKDLEGVAKRVIDINGNKYFVPNPDEQGWMREEPVTIESTIYKGTPRFSVVEDKPERYAPASRLPYQDTRTDMNPFFDKRIWVFNVEVPIPFEMEDEEPQMVSQYLHDQIDKIVGKNYLRRLQRADDISATFQVATITFEEVLEKINVSSVKGWDKIIKKILAATKWSQTHSKILRGSGELESSEIYYSDNHADSQILFTEEFTGRLFKERAKEGQEIHVQGFIEGIFTKGNAVVVKTITDDNGLPTKKCVRIQGRHFAQKPGIRLKSGKSILYGYCYHVADEASMPTTALGPILKNGIKAIDQSLKIRIGELQEMTGADLLDAFGIESDVYRARDRLLNHLGVKNEDPRRMEMQTLALGAVQHRMSRKFLALEDKEELDLNGEKTNFTLKGTFKREIKAVRECDIGCLITKKQWDHLCTEPEPGHVPAVLSEIGPHIFVGPDHINIKLWKAYDGYDHDDTIEIIPTKVTNANRFLGVSYRIPTPLHGIVRLDVMHNEDVIVYDVEAAHEAVIQKAALHEMVIMDGDLARETEEKHLAICAANPESKTAKELKAHAVEDTAARLNEFAFGNWFNWHKAAQFILMYNVFCGNTKLLETIKEIAYTSPSDVLDDVKKGTLSPERRERLDAQIGAMKAGLKNRDFKLARYQAVRQQSCLNVWKPRWAANAIKRGQHPQEAQERAIAGKTFEDQLYRDNVVLQKTVNEFKENVKKLIKDAILELRKIEAPVATFKTSPGFEMYYNQVASWFAQTIKFDEIISHPSIAKVYGKYPGWLSAVKKYRDNRRRVVRERSDLLRTTLVPEGGDNDFAYHGFAKAIQAFDDESDKFSMLLRLDDLDNVIRGLTIRDLGKLRKVTHKTADRETPEMKSIKRQCHDKGFPVKQFKLDGWQHLVTFGSTIKQTPAPEMAGVIDKETKAKIYKVLW